MTFSSAALNTRDTLFVINSHDFLGSAQGWAVPTSGAYPLSNLALFVPFSVTVPCTVVEGYAVCGSVAGGNFDIGVYDDAGARLSSSGATARAVSLPVNTTAFTNLDLVPDRYYYMAISHDGTNNFFSTTSAAGLYAAMGVLERATSYVLPSDASSWVITTRAYLPAFGLNLIATAL